MPTNVVLWPHSAVARHSVPEVSSPARGKSKVQGGQWPKGSVLLRQELVDEQQAVNSLWAMGGDVPPVCRRVLRRM